MIKKGLYYVEKIKSLGSAEIRYIKEKLIIFKNELIRKNRLNNRNNKYLDDYNSNIKYRGIKDIRHLFNKEVILLREYIYNGIKDRINNIQY